MDGDSLGTPFRLSPILLEVEESVVKDVVFIISRAWNNKQLLDEVFVISGIIKVEVIVISRSRRLRLITLTETLIISDITKTESNNCFIIHCFKANNDKRIIAPNTFIFDTPCSYFTVGELDIAVLNLTLLLEIMHCARNLQIIH